MAHHSCECCSTQDPDRHKRNVREYRTREEERATFFRQCNAALRLIENAPFCDARTLALERLKELESYWAVKVPADSLPASARSESSAAAARDRSTPRVNSRNAAFEEHLRARRRLFEPINGGASDSVDSSPRRSRLDKYRDVPCRVYDARTPRKLPESQSREGSPRRRSLSASSQGERVPRVALLADRAAEAGALRRRGLEAKRAEQQALVRKRSQSQPRMRTSSAHSQYASVPSTLHRYFTGKEPMVPPKDNPRSIIESRRAEEDRLTKRYPRSSTPGRSFPAPVSEQPTPTTPPRRPTRVGGGSAEGSPVRGRAASCPEKKARDRGEAARPPPKPVAPRRTSSVPLLSPTDLADVPGIALAPGTPQAAQASSPPEGTPTKERPVSPLGSVPSRSGSVVDSLTRSPAPSLRGSISSPAPSVSRDGAPRFQSPATARPGQSPARTAGMVTLDFHLGRVPRRRSRDDGSDDGGRRLSRDEDLRDPLGLRSALAAVEAAQKGGPGPHYEEDLSTSGEQPELIARLSGLDAVEISQLAARVSEAVQDTKRRGSNTDLPQVSSLDKGSPSRPNNLRESAQGETMDDVWAIQSFNEDFA
eukprot:EG_transcript_4994